MAIGLCANGDYVFIITRNVSYYACFYRLAYIAAVLQVSSSFISQRVRGYTSFCYAVFCIFDFEDSVNCKEFCFR